MILLFLFLKSLCIYQYDFYFYVEIIYICTIFLKNIYILKVTCLNNFYFINVKIWYGIPKDTEFNVHYKMNPIKRKTEKRGRHQFQILWLIDELYKN